MMGSESHKCCGANSSGAKQFGEQARVSCTEQVGGNYVQLASGATKLESSYA